LCGAKANGLSTKAALSRRTCGRSFPSPSTPNSRSAGAFADPERRQPIGEANVTCPVGGREQGLGFLLDTFARHGTKATFFVEALQTAWFGDAPMAGMIDRILTAGQDVQLHLHPCWTTFRDPDWRAKRGEGDPDDHCDGRDVDGLQTLIEQGIEAFARMGAPRPIALRTGNLRADRNVYRAMLAAGIPLASNIGLGLNRPTDPALQLHGGRHRIEGVLEVPVLTYRAGGADRLFTTTASSWRETEHLLWAAHAAGVETLVLLTHPFEFIKGDRLDPARQRVNRINQSRLERLCAFIAEHQTPSSRSASAAPARPGWTRPNSLPLPCRPRSCR
jgi:peptidoglycan/xylan/chitin deacetylase (PgdA/CDA1 family)